MMRGKLSATAVAVFVMFPIGATAVQTTLADEAVMHTEAGGAYVSVGAAAAPADFTTPDAYATGTLHLRAIVDTLPAMANTTTYKVCFVQGAETACSDNAISFSAAGTFDASQAMDTLTNYAGIDWTMPLDDIEVVAMDTAGVAVDATETTWVGNPDYTLYYPIDLTFQAVVVADGDAFEGFPGDGMAAEAPSISPDGGQFEGMVSVSLSTGTADGMIYYTTDGTDPDNTSTLWEGTPLEISADTTVKAITYATDLDPSPIAEATFQIVDELTVGLRGRYYNGGEFDELVFTRTDPVIDFSWDSETTPSPDIDNPFSIIWTGQVTPRYSDNYTFKTVNDDGVRLWVNDQLLIDDWTGHGPEERTGQISLTADQPVSIWLEYYNGGGPGEISLSWVSDQQPEELIPDTQTVPQLPGNMSAVVTLLGGMEEAIQESHPDPVELQLRRRGDIDSAITVNIELGGTATNGVDYNMINPTVQLGAGELTKTIEIIPIDDDEVEEYEETIIVTVVDGSGYTVSSPSTQTITLLDNDVDLFAISGTITYTGTESGDLIVEAFRETDEVFNKRQTSLINPGPYTLENLEPGDYTVIAYVDANDNERLDEDETWNIYQGADLNPALVTVPPGATDIDINLDIEPGEDPNQTEDDEGCCATVGGRSERAPVWLALLLATVVVRLRRRSR